MQPYLNNTVVAFHICSMGQRIDFENKVHLLCRDTICINSRFKKAIPREHLGMSRRNSQNNS